MKKNARLFIKCFVCGKEFKPKDKQSKYCSRECLYISLKKIRKRQCKICGKEFVLDHRYINQICCSTNCQRKHLSNYYKELYKDLYKNKLEKQKLYQQLKNKLNKLKQRYNDVQNKLQHIKQCNECNKLFYAKNTNIKYCSKKCRNKVYNRKHDKRIYRNGKPDLSITLTKLYMRDNGVCQLCGKHIDFDCYSNSDYYPSIDHIKPISKGGLHNWDNVQLTCRKCNSIKRDSF